MTLSAIIDIKRAAEPIPASQLLNITLPMNDRSNEHAIIAAISLKVFLSSLM